MSTKKSSTGFLQLLFFVHQQGRGKNEGQLIVFSQRKETFAKALELLLLLLLLEKHDQNCGCLVAVSLSLQVGKKGFCLLTEGIIITATMWETMLGKGFKVSKW